MIVDVPMRNARFTFNTTISRAALYIVYTLFHSKSYAFKAIVEIYKQPIIMLAFIYSPPSLNTYHLGALSISQN
jgi:hypothetical protein